MMSNGMVTIYNKDCLDMSEIQASTIQTVVTSPPYWGLRDYKVEGQLGLEKTPEEYVQKMVKVFREVKRVLRKDGTVWLNFGDGYAHNSTSRNPEINYRNSTTNGFPTGNFAAINQPNTIVSGLKPKDLIGIPWRVAFALQADGWYLRCDIIWSKPNPMPESVQDRPTRAHEYIFLLSKSARYYYDADAIREPFAESTIERINQPSFDLQTGGPKDPLNGNRSCRKTLENLAKSDKQRGHSLRHAGFNDRWDAMTKEEQQLKGANKRSVWTIATQPYPEAHFATFPEALVEPCILAGSKPGDTVLDPFLGSGTTAWVAQRLGRKCIGYELNPDYCELARKRNQQVGMVL